MVYVFEWICWLLLYEISAVKRMELVEWLVWLSFDKVTENAKNMAYVRCYSLKTANDFEGKGCL
jgi:hypothetical protein